MKMTFRAFPAFQIAALAALIGSIASCGKNEGPVDPSANMPEDAVFHDVAEGARHTHLAFDLRDVNEVIAAHDAALNARDFWLYSHLLTADFTFWPRPQDWSDFPWMDGYSWPEFEELNMIDHMFNPNFYGGVPAVQSIQLSTQIFNTNEIAPGHIELTCVMQGSVLTSDTDGWSVDTGLVFDLVSGGAGYQIQKITETDPVGRVEGSSWGSIKGLYRAVY